MIDVKLAIRGGAPLVWQGVTSDVADNCGFSIAPARDADRDALPDARDRRGHTGAAAHARARFCHPT